VSTSVISVEQLDLEISVAYIALGGARGLWDRCPSAENQRRVDEAETELNRLLDQRFAVAP
jgi:hypothetical protein